MIRYHKLLLALLAAFVLVCALSYHNLKMVGVTHAQMLQFLEIEGIWLAKLYIYTLALCFVWVVGKRLFPSRNEKRYRIPNARNRIEFLAQDAGEFRIAPGSVMDSKRF